MTDKITKFLSKLSAKDLDTVRGLVLRIVEDDLKGLNVTKLKGSVEIYRLKKGDIRIIYRANPGSKPKFLSIERRSEKTYKNY